MDQFESMSDQALATEGNKGMNGNGCIIEMNRRLKQSVLDQTAEMRRLEQVGERLKKVAIYVALAGVAVSGVGIVVAILIARN